MDRTESIKAKAGARAAALLGIVALGLLTIVGSGGGGGVGFPDMSCLNEPGFCGNGNFTIFLPWAEVTPGRTATTVGGSAEFSASSNLDQPTYRWCRLGAGATECNDIPGASGPSYRVSGANLVDDGATYRVAVTGTNGSAYGFARLAVSSMPGVAYQDGEFLDADWGVTVLASPTLGGPVVSLARTTAGGNPGAFRMASYELPQVASSVRVFYAASTALYDPAVQGAVYLIDFAEDCINKSSTNVASYTGPMIEQAGRRFVATQSAFYCRAATWHTVHRSSVTAQDFELADGPPCAAGQACPDFSAQGAPIRLGLVAGAALSGGPAQTGHGFDNWKVTVWRK
jgi:hypothetical protein